MATNRKPPAATHCEKSDLPTLDVINKSLLPSYQRKPFSLGSFPGGHVKELKRFLGGIWQTLRLTCPVSGGEGVGTVWKKELFHCVGRRR